MNNFTPQFNLELFIEPRNCIQTMGLFHDYRPILNDSEDGPIRVKRGSSRLRILGTFLLTLILCAVSFAAGQYRPPPKIPCEKLISSTSCQKEKKKENDKEKARTNSGAPVATKPSVFEYDPSFQDQQSPSIDEKWRGLFPKREGFFTHPTIAPQRSALAVFHQLHCLVCFV